MAQCDLDVEGRGDHVTDQEEDETIPIGGDAAVEDSVAEPRPEECYAGEFEPAVPPRWTSFGTETADEVYQGLGVEVEATEKEDWVV